MHFLSNYIFGSLKGKERGQDWRVKLIPIRLSENYKIKSEERGASNLQFIYLFSIKMFFTLFKCKVEKKENEQIHNSSINIVFLIKVKG